ncbi:DUF1177 domain-containing protein [Alicyclobacillus fastidiosus]|uniref:DUF1177 domain-containing protein n=1 Tax=Alicyclobacillus fastidiosus TaxID=392011 RepID=A0ABY6ZGR4_9BACL|nr:DUF1177 domain-containing protein [Alicyclobacillus fastidiosus]WAH42090.1 DUF1177 domain-containing protein [Alicyclobacillus fastidiosus]GMA63857.1 hypothetical protein GCM10025859_42970 [Alicyclobacillus fastidiosus]
MTLKQTMELYELLDDPQITGLDVKDFLEGRGASRVDVETVVGEPGSTDFIRVCIPGRNGKTSGGDAPTLGVIGRLGGIGARPERIGLVSDGDGAIAALAAALKLTQMHNKGDILAGDVMIATHICPNAPTIVHHPVNFMGSPVDMYTMNQHEVSGEMDAILTIDTTKGNRVFNYRGVAISPTVKEGCILPISHDLVSLLEITSGRLAHTFAVSMQDITPYGNQLYHINSILQPCVATSAPVVGVAITAESTVPGCATGASHEIDIATAARFVIEVAKAFGAGTCSFYDEVEFSRFVDLYGSMRQLQTLGRTAVTD